MADVKLNQIFVADLMHYEYVCGRFSKLQLHVWQISCAKSKTLFVTYLIADFSWNKKNVTNLKSRLAKIGIFFCYLDEFSFKLADFFCKLTDFLPNWPIFYTNLKLFFLFESGRSVGSGKLTQICSGSNPDLLFVKYWYAGLKKVLLV